MKKILLYLAIVLVFPHHVMSQPQPRPFFFYNVTGQGHHLNAYIYDFVQDSLGFMWFGTDYGLLRYDGYRAVRISVADRECSNILGSVGVLDLTLAPDNSLWIGTREGLLNLTLGTYAVARPEIFREKVIREILYISDTLIWVGADEGLYRYQPKSGAHRYYGQLNSNLSQNTVEALYLDRSGNLWVGTDDKLNVLYAGAEEFVSIDLKGAYKPEIKHNLIPDIQAFRESSDSILLIGTETGLCLLNRYSLEFTSFNEKNSPLVSEVVKTIYARDPSAIYFGTDLGFYRLNLETGEIERYFHNPFNRYSIVNNEVWKVGPDRTGDLWLATSNGISRVTLSDQLFQYIPVYFRDSGEPVGTRVADVLQDQEGQWWVASSSGIYVSREMGGTGMEFSKEPEKLPLSIGNINTLSVDRRNRIWIGSVAGINIWDPANREIHVPAMDQSAVTRVASNYISAIFPVSDEQIWIGTWGGGLYLADAGAEQLERIDIHYIADLNGQMVMGDDHLWALDGQVLSRFSFNTRKVEEITALSELARDVVLTSHCYSEKRCLWIGSRNQLIRYDPENGNIRRVSMPIDEDFIVIGLIEDENGFIWGCSSNTIFRFDPEEETFHYFPIPEGTPLKKLILSPFRKTAGGEIAVCGYDGFLLFNPGRFSAADEHQKIRITSLKVNGELVQPNMEISGRVFLRQIVSSADQVILPYGNRNLDLEYSSFHYSQIEHEQYSYMLEGYEDSWNVTEPGTNLASYVNLPPGKYIFRVRSYSSQGNEQVSSLTIRIRLPVWASPPFLSAYILVLAGILWIIVYQYRSQLRFRTQFSAIRLEKEQNEQVNAAKISFFVNISHELLNSLGLVLDPLKQLLLKKELDGNVRRTLRLIEKNARFLKLYVDQLLDFRKIEIGQHRKRSSNRLELIGFGRQVISIFRGRAASKGIQLRFRADMPMLYLETDTDKLYSILQNLLSNAIKFTPRGGSVTLAIRQVSESETMLEVKDTGVGIPEEEHEKIFDRFYQVPGTDEDSGGIGIGLTIVTEFVQVLQGRLELVSRVGEGTSFRVYLPSKPESAESAEPESIFEEIVSRKSLKEELDSNRRLNAISKLPLLLLVDENKDQFEYIRESLKSRYAVIWSPDGGGALEIMNKRIPEVIVSEIWLPDMDGVTLCRKIRKRINTASVPFMILTTRPDAHFRIEAADAGVDAYLLKPLEIAVLESSINSVLERIRRMEDHLKRRLLMTAREVDLDSTDDRLLKEVVEYIHQHMTNSRIIAEEISHAIGISHSSLYRKVKGMTGQSLSEFIRHIRVQQAEKLLAGGRMTVSEVMFRVGFTNHSYFSKCFKQQFKVTPGQYQKKAGK